jgi:hypothetical protein
MDENFWINITKPGFFYVVEKWTADEDRIVYVEKKKVFTKIRAKRYARKRILTMLCEQYIKEKL